MRHTIEWQFGMAPDEGSRRRYQTKVETFWGKRIAKTAF